MMVRCYFVRGGWRFYADTAEGHAECARDYALMVGMPADGLVCIPAGKGEIVVRMASAVAA